MATIRSIEVRPIPVDELTPEDVRLGITQDRRATLLVEGDEKAEYEVPADGAVFVLERPLPVAGTRVHARLHIYDRQAAPDYFTVRGPLALAASDEGACVFEFVQRGPPFVFMLRQVA